MNYKVWIALLMTSVAGGWSHAYEVGTHTKIADKAYKRSTISLPTKLAQY
jgi:hypothetical protein